MVDPIADAAAAFYERYDLHAVSGNPRRLVQRLSAFARALGPGWLEPPG